jgi:hypothetical protein
VVLVRLIFSWVVVQAPVSAADGELGDIVVSADDVEDDAAPGAPWLPHAVMTSPHAATAKKPKVTVRSRAAVPMSLRQAAGRACGSRTT